MGGVTKQECADTVSVPAWRKGRTGISGRGSEEGDSGPEKVGGGGLELCLSGVWMDGMDGWMDPGMDGMDGLMDPGIPVYYCVVHSVPATEVACPCIRVGVSPPTPPMHTFPAFEEMCLSQHRQSAYQNKRFKKQQNPHSSTQE